MKTYSITIGWLYPELMSTYGDRGNIIVLTKRCEWRGIQVTIERISIATSDKRLAKCDLLFMGGAQDTQQEIVNDDLFNVKGKALREKIDDGTPGLYICGAYQFLGEYYKTADGKELPGLKIFPSYTENPGENTPRLIGNIIIHSSLANSQQPDASSQTVGFENHGGRTYLKDKNMALGTVTKGFGNNGIDGTEGILYKNSVGSYLHGPILPKNPEIADWLIEKALEKKYKQSLRSSTSPAGLGKEIRLKPLDDTLEIKAKTSIISRLK